MPTHMSEQDVNIDEEEKNNKDQVENIRVNLLNIENEKKNAEAK